MGYLYFETRRHLYNHQLMVAGALMQLTIAARSCELFSVETARCDGIFGRVDAFGLWETSNWMMFPIMTRETNSNVLGYIMANWTISCCFPFVSHFFLKIYGSDSRKYPAMALPCRRETAPSRCSADTTALSMVAVAKYSFENVENQARQQHAKSDKTDHWNNGTWANSLQPKIEASQHPNYHCKGQ